jgi:hypothetical protein
VVNPHAIHRDNTAKRFCPYKILSINLGVLRDEKTSNLSVRMESDSVVKRRVLRLVEKESRVRSGEENVTANISDCMDIRSSIQESFHSLDGTTSTTQM